MPEYADYVIREAERRQESKETPYDQEIIDAEAVDEAIRQLLGSIRDIIHAYHKKYGDIPLLADALLDAEEIFAHVLARTIDEIKSKIESYEPEEEADAARADRWLDERD